MRVDPRPAGGGARDQLPVQLVNQVWSVGGNESRKAVSQMFLQPFMAYNTKSLWTITLQSEMTANWEAESDTWTVPVPTGKLRGAITILLPRRK